MINTAEAQSLEFIVDRADGSVYIKNPNDSAVTFDGYRLESFGASLDISGWTPIADNYDLDGDQSVDSVSAWIVGAADASFAEEASLTELSASLAPDQIVSLGLFFTGPLEGGSVEVFSGTASETVFIDFRTLTADYDNDLDVDLDDYNVFASTFGSTTDLRADGNNDSVIDAADYTVWRDSEELAIATLTTPARALTVPEPASSALLLFAIGSAARVRRR